MLKASFKRARAGEARPARPGRNAEALQRAAGTGRCRRTSPRDREGEPRDDPHGRPTASIWATGRAARRSRRRAAACSIPTIPKAAVGANCYACHQIAPRGTLVRHHRPVACYQFGKIARLQRRDRASTPTARSTTPQAYSACTNMPRFGHKRHPDRAADQGRRRAADGSGIAGQQVAESSRHRRRTLHPRVGATPTHREPPRIPAHDRGRGGGGLPARARARARARGRRGVLRCVAPFGNVNLLHFTDCHAQLLPVHFREPSVNLGLGEARGQPPHLVGEALLRHFGIAPGTREAHAFTLSRLRRGGAHLRSAGRFRAPRDARQAPAGPSRPGALLLDGGDTWQGSATALWTRGQDMVDAQLPRRRRDDRRTGSSRSAPIACGRSSTRDFAGKNRIPRAERAHHRFRRPGVPAVCDARPPRFRWRSSARRFRTRRSRIRAISSPTGRSASARQDLQKVVDEVARKGRAGGRTAVAQRHGRRSQARFAGARHRRDPRRAHPRRRAAADDRRQRGRQDDRHQRRQQRQISRGARSRREGRQGPRLPVSTCCRCSRVCCHPIRAWTR